MNREAEVERQSRVAWSSFLVDSSLMLNNRLIRNKINKAISSRSVQTVTLRQNGGECFRASFRNVVHSGSSLKREPPFDNTATVEIVAQEKKTTAHATAINC